MGLRTYLRTQGFLYNMHPLGIEKLREGNFNFNVMAQKQLWVKKEIHVYVCFMDYAKAFDRVKHENIDC